MSADGPRRVRADDLAGDLDALAAVDMLRRRRTVDAPQGPRVVVDGREVVLLCSNDYLGLAAHPEVRAAAAEAAMTWGAGAGASALVSGHMTPHARLEEELAAFKGAEACVLFGSGFLANVGIVAALAGREPGGVVLSDARNHASIVDGCRLARAEVRVYAHADLDALGRELDAVAGRPATIVTDAVFSMDGDRAPLAGIVALARRHGARVVVDEAHATGVVGPGGRGLVAELGLEDEVDVVVGTLGKALGSYGAFACASRTTADWLVNHARTVIFSTALPPVAVEAARAALRLVRADPALVARASDRAATLREALAGAGIDAAPGGTPIVPVLAGAPGAATAVADGALDRGFLASAIRPPTVPAGTSRLRLVATAAHDEADLRAAAAAIADAAAEAGVALGPVAAGRP